MYLLRIILVGQRLSRLPLQSLRTSVRNATPALLPPHLVQKMVTKAYHILTDFVASFGDVLASFQDSDEVCCIFLDLFDDLHGVGVSGPARGTVKSVCDQKDQSDKRRVDPGLEDRHAFACYLDETFSLLAFFFADLICLRCGRFFAPWDPYVLTTEQIMSVPILNLRLQ